MDAEDYGDIADEDLIEAFSQASQILPSHLPSSRPAKRRRFSEQEDNGHSNRHRHRSHSSTEDGVSEDEGGENPRTKKPKYKIHVAAQAVSPAKIIGATQAEALLNSSPYRMRGPIYKNPRPEPLKPPSPVTQRPVPKPNIFQTQSNQPPPPQDTTFDLDMDLENLPSDAFSTPEKTPIEENSMRTGSSPLQVTQASQMPRQRLVAPSKGLRQITLYGSLATAEPPASQTKKVLNYKQDKPPEAPTHHPLDENALKTWVFPTNLGAIRDYQYSIVKNGLFNNLLVALPTGLGKTFIAATIMLNFFRWTKNSQIVFVAPTKPLVAQQVDACFNIVGIPKSQTTMLTGEQAPALRAEEWAEKRVFFMTPQTFHNDLATGIADPKKIVLLVVDEAHRATGNYSYVTVVKFLRRFNQSFRILALTATPGASVEAVQEVIDNLEISKVEIRTEESMDIQQFVHRRDIDQILLDPSDEILRVKELFAKALQPLVNQLCSQSAYWNRDPMALTPWGLMQARKSWMGSDAGRRANPGLKGMVNALFSILASVAHSIKLLNFHGIGPFFSSIKDFRQGVEDTNKPGKYRSQIVDNPDFKKMMSMVQAWINKDEFVGHPKLTYLCDSILNHFLDAGEGRHGEDAPPSATRVIVFAEFRDSAEEIARVLNRHGPLIRASVFVGQADSKRSEGMNQAKQLETIQKFKSGKINVIVATSIGEEGLDIGQVDLIVCYDASASPIRMLQRMGRTGRKRAGNIVLLLVRGKEEEAFAKAKDNYEQMQKMISSGARFNFRHDLSVRIIPRDIFPEVDKRMIEIPIENTQDPSLPEPRRRPTKPRKKPAKKFHMPDGVETGFKKASKLSAEGQPLSYFGIPFKNKESNKIQPLLVPPSESVLLSPIEELELERRYQNIVGDDMQEVSMPEMSAQTVAQRTLRPVGTIAHGQYTKRCVRLFKTLSRSRSKDSRFSMPYGDREQSLSYLVPPNLLDEFDVEIVQANPQKLTVPQKAVQRKRTTKPNLVISDIESEGDEDDQEISGDDTEGEGDDLMNSEEPSEDESDGGESLRDFIADSSSQLFVSQTIIRSSTTPPPTGQKASQVTSSREMDLDSEFPYLSRLTPEIKELSRPVISIDSDDTVLPSRRRKDKRRVIQDSDSDSDD